MKIKQLIKPDDKPIKKAKPISSEMALAFLDYYNKTVPLSFFSTGENNGLSKDAVWNKFLKKYKKK